MIPVRLPLGPLLLVRAVESGDYFRVWRRHGVAWIDPFLLRDVAALEELRPRRGDLARFAGAAFELVLLAACRECYGRGRGCQPCHLTGVEVELPGIRLTREDLGLEELVA